MSLAFENKSPRPNIDHYADEQAALDAFMARLANVLVPQEIWLFRRPQPPFRPTCGRPPSPRGGRMVAKPLRPINI
jgi:hypothetical protein